MEGLLQPCGHGRLVRIFRRQRDAGLHLRPFWGIWFCDKFGRRNTLIFAGLLFAASAVGTALPKDLVTFNVFRFIDGVAIGLSSIASPMYIAELAPARFRGRLGLMYQMAITVGSTSSMLVGYYLSFGAHWRCMFASEIVPIAIFVVLLTMVPKSPRWLAENGHEEEAEAILTRIDGTESAQKGMAEIRRISLKKRGALGSCFCRT